MSSSLEWNIIKFTKTYVLFKSLSEAAGGGRIYDGSLFVACTTTDDGGPGGGIREFRIF